MRQSLESGGVIEDEDLPLIRRYMGACEGRTEWVFQTPEEVAAIVIRTLEEENPPVLRRTTDRAEAFAAPKTGADPEGRLARGMVIDAMLGGRDGLFQDR